MDRLEQEVEVVKFYASLRLSAGDLLTQDEIAQSFVVNYAEKYAEIWHDGITTKELNRRLFYN